MICRKWWRREDTNWFEFTDQKLNWNAIDFRWLDVNGEDEEDNNKANLIDSLQMQSWWVNFS